MRKYMIVTVSIAILLLAQVFYENNSDYLIGGEDDTIEIHSLPFDKETNT